MPDQKDPAFSLTTSFTPAGENRQFLTGFLAVDSDAGNQPGVRRAGYGKMRLLELPGNTNVMGPAQVQNQISTSNQNSTDFQLTLSQFLNLNNQSGSRVPVSYTHLDVYKRQDQGRPGRGRGAVCAAVPLSLIHI